MTSGPSISVCDPPTQNRGGTTQAKRLRSLLLSVGVLVDDYVQLIGTNRRIFNHFLTFGHKINNSPAELRRSLLFLLQCVAWFVLSIKLILHYELPFSGVISDFVPVIGALLIFPATVGVYVAARIVLRNRDAPYGIFALNAYWVGFIVSVVLPCFMILSLPPADFLGVFGVILRIFFSILFAVLCMQTFFSHYLWTKQLYRTNYLRAWQVNYLGFGTGFLVLLIPYFVCVSIYRSFVT
jgi:hypothetical protein